MKKKSARLIFLIAVLALVSLPITPAHAHGPICQNIEGAPCSPEGSERRCVDAIDGGPGICICTGGVLDCGTGF